VVYSHLVDPKVGLGRTRFQQATVIAPIGVEADAWATALCLLDAADGIRRIDAKPGFAARIVTRPGDTMVSQTSARWPANGSAAGQPPAAP
jgi:thiamine biosynthesis lipoprotein